MESYLGVAENAGASAEEVAVAGQVATIVTACRTRERYRKATGRDF